MTLIDGSTVGNDDLRGSPHKLKFLILSRHRQFFNNAGKQILINDFTNVMRTGNKGKADGNVVECIEK
jgi:hypothetical protein